MNWVWILIFAFLVAAPAQAAKPKGKGKGKGKPAPRAVIAPKAEPLPEAKKCSSSGVCIGDTVYYVQFGEHQKAKVTGFNPHYDDIKLKVEGEAKERFVPSSYVAIVTAGTCLTEGSKFCVGKHAIPKDEWGGADSREIVGVSPSKHTVFVREGISIKRTGVNAFESETHDAPVKSASPGYIEKCAGALCPGMSVYVQANWDGLKATKILGTNVRGDAVKFLLDGQVKSIPAEYAAITTSDSCHKERPEICVGHYANRRDASGNMINAQIVGLFSGGAIAVEEKDKFMRRTLGSYISFTKEPAPNTPPPPFVEKCLEGVCPGATGYVYSFAGKFQKYKIFGTNEAGTSLRAETEDQPGLRDVHFDSIAIEQEGLCHFTQREICVGGFANRLDMKGNLISEPITAVNPKGGLIVTFVDGNLAYRDRHNFASFTKELPPPFTTECVKTVCPGDPIFSMQRDRPEPAKVLGKVAGSYLKIQAEGKEMESLDLYGVASAKEGTCGPYFKDACVGTYGISEVGGVSKAAKILAIGVADSGVAIVEEDGKIRKRALKAFSRFSKQRPPKITHQWVIEGGTVIGCLEEIEIFPSDDPACNVEFFPALECGGRRTKELVKDIKVCRQKLPAENAWVKVEGVYQCAAILETAEGGAKKGVIAELLKPQDCDHKFYELDPTSCFATPAGRLDFHPLNNFGLDKLIPEIMNLKTKQAVPPEVYKKYDSKRIALTIHYKMYKEYEESKTQAAKNSYDFLDGTAIQMAFWDKNTDSILKNGFLNQHQTSTTSGCLCPEKRAIAENKMLGYQLETTYKKETSNPVNKVRPKYSVLGFQKGDIDDSPISGTPATPVGASTYGNVIAVFNPEVKDRTTFTMTDSLSPAQYTTDDKYKGLRTTRVRTDENLKQEAGSYVEAQIWGELKVSDVNYFLVGCSSGNLDVAAASIKKLQAAGKEVYKCEIQNDQEGRPRRMVKGARIP